MNRPHALVALLVVMTIPLAACGSTATTAPTSAAAQPLSSTSESAEVGLTAQSAEVGLTEAITIESAPVSAIQPTASEPAPVVTTDTQAAVDEVTTTPPPPAATTSGGTMIVVDDSDFGPILFDGTGQAIYLFDSEPTATPACYDDCAVAWPPVLTLAAPVSGSGVQTELLGVTPRSDGSMQVTYSGHPLYFYANEGKNSVTCHNVNEFGGLWLVVTPAGQAGPQ